MERDDVTKKYRQTEILKLIREQRIHTQEELCTALQKVGIEVAQVTLSRDLRELGIVKGAEGYRESERPPSEGEEHSKASKRALEEFVRGISTAQNLVIIRTAAGNSAPVAYAMDNIGWPEVVGTIAGEDTVFVAAPDAKQALKVKEKLLSLLQ
jgi:transcriptional regulator of arginine metabolism